MRYVVIFLILFISLHEQISAQERDTLVGKVNTAKTLPRSVNMQLSQGEPSLPILFQDFTNNLNLQNPVLKNLNFNLMNGWKINSGSFMDSKSMNGFPFSNNQIGLYGRSVWELYQGTYGIRTYQVNNKLFVGSAGYSVKSVNEYSQQSGIYRQTNYSSSLFVGYKFSDKFSISAGFTIRSNGDPLNRNQGIQNGGIFP
jgi:hypothetical protein